MAARADDAAVIAVFHDEQIGFATGTLGEVDEAVDRLGDALGQVLRDLWGAW